MFKILGRFSRGSSDSPQQAQQTPSVESQVEMKTNDIPFAAPSPVTNENLSPAKQPNISNIAHLLPPKANISKAPSSHVSTTVTPAQSPPSSTQPAIPASVAAFLPPPRASATASSITSSTRASLYPPSNATASSRTAQLYPVKTSTSSTPSLSTSASNAMAVTSSPHPSSAPPQHTPLPTATSPSTASTQPFSAVAHRPIPSAYLPSPHYPASAANTTSRPMSATAPVSTSASAHVSTTAPPLHTSATHTNTSHPSSAQPSAPHLLPSHPVTSHSTSSHSTASHMSPRTLSSHASAPTSSSTSAHLPPRRHTSSPSLSLALAAISTSSTPVPTPTLTPAARAGVASAPTHAPYARTPHAQVQHAHAQYTQASSTDALYPTSAAASIASSSTSTSTSTSTPGSVTAPASAASTPLTRTTALLLSSAPSTSPATFSASPAPSYTPLTSSTPAPYSTTASPLLSSCLPSRSTPSSPALSHMHPPHIHALPPSLTSLPPPYVHTPVVTLPLASRIEDLLTRVMQHSTTQASGHASAHTTPAQYAHVSSLSSSNPGPHSTSHHGTVIDMHTSALPSPSSPSSEHLQASSLHSTTFTAPLIPVSTSTPRAASSAPLPPFAERLLDSLRSDMAAITHAHTHARADTPTHADSHGDKPIPPHLSSSQSAALTATATWQHYLSLQRRIAHNIHAQQANSAVMERLLSALHTRLRNDIVLDMDTATSSSSPSSSFATSALCTPSARSTRAPGIGSGTGSLGSLGVHGSRSAVGVRDATHLLLSAEHVPQALAHAYLRAREQQQHASWYAEVEAASRRSAWQCLHDASAEQGALIARLQREVQFLRGRVGAREQEHRDVVSGLTEQLLEREQALAQARDKSLGGGREGSFAREEQEEMLKRYRVMVDELSRELAAARQGVQQGASGRGGLYGRDVVEELGGTPGITGINEARDVREGHGYGEYSASSGGKVGAANSYPYAPRVHIPSQHGPSSQYPSYSSSTPTHTADSGTIPRTEVSQPPMDVYMPNVGIEGPSTLSMHPFPSQHAYTHAEGDSGSNAGHMHPGDPHLSNMYSNSVSRYYHRSTPNLNFTSQTETPMTMFPASHGNLSQDRGNELP